MWPSAVLCGAVLLRWRCGAMAGRWQCGAWWT